MRHTAIALLLSIGFLLSCDSKPKVNSHIVKSASTDSIEVFNDTSVYSGILILHLNILHQNALSISIYNPDKTVYTKIACGTDNEEPASPVLSGRILAYFPDYYIMHFNACPLSDSIYKVKVGDSYKLIKSDTLVAYVSWQEYILRFYAVTDTTNPLKEAPLDDSRMMYDLNYDVLSFKCLEIKGDWVKVRCLMECEACPQNKSIVGWIRWRKDGKVILKQLYAC